MNNKLTEEQQNFILENYKTMSNKNMIKIMNDPNFTTGKIDYFLKKNDLKRDKPCYKNNSIFSKEDILFIINNYKTMTYRQMENYINFDEKQIRSKAEYLGLVKNRIIDDNYFNDINTPLKSYFLGYIYADGYIVCNEKIGNYEFGMELQSSDKYILEKLNKELGDSNIIYHNEQKMIQINGITATRKDTDLLRVYSKNLVYNLIKNGIEPNKTQKTTYPIVEENLFFDFLRGYIDGDGCFYSNNNKIIMHITCAKKEPLVYIQQKLKKYEIYTSIYSENENKNRLMCFRESSVKLLINRLYYSDGLFYLKRKYEKIKHLIGSAT